LGTSPYASTNTAVLQSAEQVTPIEAVVARCAEHLDSLREYELPSRHAVGVLIQGVISNAAYGDSAVPDIAASLHVKTSVLYGHARVAKTWPQNEFATLCDRSEGSFRLSWSHFLLLSAEKDPQARSELIEQTFTSRLSEKELRAKRKQVREAAQATSPSTHGQLGDFIGEMHNLQGQFRKVAGLASGAAPADLASARVLVSQLEAELTRLKQLVGAAPLPFLLPRTASILPTPALSNTPFTPKIPGS
jgi:hypothetical protein